MRRASPFLILGLWISLSGTTGAHPLPQIPSSGAPSAATTIRSNITQFGITWTFAKPSPVGTFVTGDYFVVGATEVIHVEPEPLTGDAVPRSEIGPREFNRIRKNRFVRNGSMLNPPARPAVAFDSGIRNYFEPDLLAKPPLRLKPGDCLVSSISLKAGESPSYPYHCPGGSRESGDNSPVRTAAILTCLASVPPADAFRPSYADPSAALYRASSLQRSRLPRLKAPDHTPDLDVWIRILERPWINPCFFGFEQPMENMPHYGQWVGQAQSVAGLLLLLDLDPAKKEQLLLHLTQVGIDYWGLIKKGHRGWQGWGGHGSGRKFPIVMAGLLLGDPEMASPNRSFPRAEFSEDNQSIYGSGWTGARALFAGHSGVQSASGKSDRPKWGPYEHLHPSQWTADQCQSEEYRRANTSSSWIGQALTLRLLKAEDSWAHQAFFDYADRWMTEPDDATHRKVIMQHHPKLRFGDDARFTHQGQAWEPFVNSMWSRYRSLGAPAQPVGGTSSTPVPLPAAKD